jgi:antiviral helicase SKI2
LSHANVSQFEMQHDEWQVKENISQLKQLMSDQNLQLLPDYEQRVQVLRDLGFVDEESRVQLKGKVACEVRGRELSIAILPLFLTLIADPLGG